MCRAGRSVAVLVAGMVVEWESSGGACWRANREEGFGVEQRRKMYNVFLLFQGDVTHHGQVEQLVLRIGWDPSEQNNKTRGSSSNGPWTPPSPQLPRDGLALIW